MKNVQDNSAYNKYIFVSVLSIVEKSTCQVLKNRHVNSWRIDMTIFVWAIVIVFIFKVLLIGFLFILFMFKSPFGHRVNVRLENCSLLVFRKKFDLDQMVVIHTDTLEN